MNTTALASAARRRVRPGASTIGLKAAMAVTGAVLFAFVVAHLIGNLQVYRGPEKLNAYAAFLQATKGLLWGTRIALLASVIVHVAAAARLTRLARAARPIAYRMKSNVQATYASRTMLWSGLVIAAFVVYHLLHFTLGTAHPSFDRHDVYANVVSGFRVLPASVAYIVAMLLLGMHLFHGLASAFQTLGCGHPRYAPWIKRAAGAVAFAIVLCNVSIPIAVMTGVVGN